MPGSHGTAAYRSSGSEQHLNAKNYTEMIQMSHPPYRQVDYRTALAGGLFDSPGVYAVLVGSGMSSAAGIKTGWEVAQELVRRVARDQNVHLELTGLEPKEWWEREGFGELSYSNLIEGLASTELARRALLRGFFEPGPENPVEPTAAHRSLARLCALGLVEVIVTTNFDPLVERALSEVGLTPQVISSESQVKGMTPLHHAPLSVIKVHGDYASPELKNTDLELSSFGPGMNELLDEVFDRFGVVIVGWSAMWDHALREAFERRATRRYPTYYAAYNGHLSEAAQRLVTQQQSHVIEISGASEFLGDLVDRVHILAERSQRRAAPRRLRSYSLAPSSNSTPTPWAATPLLTIRTVATVGPADAETTRRIGPAERRGLIAALNESRVTRRLRELALKPLGSRQADPTVDVQGDVPLDGWIATLDPKQTTDHATYRLGGDCSSGIAAIFEVRTPVMLMSGGSVTFTLDMGFSVIEKLQIETVAELFRCGLQLVSAEGPEAFRTMLPPQAEVGKCELHMLACTMNKDGSPRSNPITDSIVFDRLHNVAYQEPDPGPQVGYAAEISGGLSRSEATDITMDAIEQMVLDSGFQDPSIGLERVRVALETALNKE